jgi:hypothetical protein
MVTRHDRQQYIPFIKPLLNGLRSARDTSSRHRYASDPGSRIPAETLALAADAHALRWGFDMSDGKEVINIAGNLQATNTSGYTIRISAIRLVKPNKAEVLTRVVTVEDAESGAYSAENMIPPRRIGKVSFFIAVKPVTAAPGEVLEADIGVLDQFANEHTLRELQFEFAGPHLLLHSPSTQPVALS